MVARSFRADRLDVAAFAKAAETLSGQSPQSAFGRLVDTLLPGAGGADDRAPVTWAARGELRRPRVGPPETWLHLSCSTQGRLTCQRCLEPLDVDLSVEDRAFRFAPDEASAVALDEEIEDDVLVMGTAFDLLNLIEDELLLTLPWVPRHAHCPGVPGAKVRIHAEGEAPTGDEAEIHDPSTPDRVAGERRPSAFAALAGLKVQPVAPAQADGDPETPAAPGGEAGTARHPAKPPGLVARKPRPS